MTATGDPDRSGGFVSVLDAARDGDRAALARLVSVLERGGPDAAAVDRLATAAGGGSYVVGITGSPGAGKSTLTNSLVARLRRRGGQVAVLAIDPSSPFSGGAILGDRIRMADAAADDGVFIRSLSTRGHLGGLAVAVPAVARLLDAVGFDWVIVETVGVGQVEVAIAREADTTVVVVNPGWGDSVQANKAGIMEIGDVFVVNKADRLGSGDTIGDLQRMLHLSIRSAWEPPIVPTVATTGDGVDDLAAAIEAHRRHHVEVGAMAPARAQRRRREVTDRLVERVLRHVELRSADPPVAAILTAVEQGTVSPVAAAAELFDEILGPQGDSSDT